MMSFAVFSTFILFQVTYAANIRVTKTSAGQIKIGDVLEVTISINNLESSGANVTVHETITGADPVDPPTFNTAKCPPNVRYCAVPPFYLWNAIINPNSVYTITYKIKPLTVSEYGIAPTMVTVGEETFYSNNLNVIVHCIPNGKCEADKGENNVNCPEDCKSAPNVTTKNGIPWIYIVLIISLVAAVVVAYFLLKNYTIQT
jgi:hypothetical protein